MARLCTLRVLALIAAGLLAAVACSPQDTGPAGAGAGSGKTLVVNTAFGAATEIDPARGQTLARLVNGARFDTLMIFEGSNPEPVPHLAASYDASSDNRKFTFHLRDDVRFSDGTPLTSEDVVFTYNRSIGLNMDGAEMLRGISVSAPDEYTVMLTSDEPNAAIPSIVAAQVLGIVNSQLARENGASDAPDAAVSDTSGEWLSSGDSAGAGSGPYVMVEHATGGRIRLERNEDYWGEAPGFEQVVIRNVPPETQALNVRRGEYEIALNLGANDLPTLRNDPNVKVVTGLSPQSALLFSNMSPDISQVSSNQHLQQAIRYAIDYDALMDLAGQDAERAAAVIPGNIPGVLPEEDATERNLDRARSELAASGIADPSITIEYVSGGGGFGGIPNESIAQVIQNSVQEAGINVTLEGSASNIFLDRYLAGDIAWGIVPATPPVTDPVTTANHLPGGFLGRLVGWAEGANPELEQLAQQAEQAPSPERLELWQEVQRRMADEGPWIPLLNPVAAIVTTTDVAGATFNPGSIFEFRPVRPVSE